MNQNDMADLSSRSERLIAALTGAFLSASEVAAERLELAAEVSRVTSRMAAFGAVLDAVGTQKAVLLAKLETATGATRALLKQQVELLTCQETAILTRVGVPEVEAKAAVLLLDDKTQTYARDGRRFAKIGGNG